MTATGDQDIVAQLTWSNKHKSVIENNNNNNNNNNNITKQLGANPSETSALKTVTYSDAVTPVQGKRHTITVLHSIMINGKANLQPDPNMYCWTHGYQVQAIVNDPF